MAAESSSGSATSTAAATAAQQRLIRLTSAGTVAPMTPSASRENLGHTGPGMDTRPTALPPAVRVMGFPPAGAAPTPLPVGPGGATSSGTGSGRSSGSSTPIGGGPTTFRPRRTASMVDAAGMMVAASERTAEQNERHAELKRLYQQDKAEMREWVASQLLESSSVVDTFTILAKIISDPEVPQLGDPVGVDKYSPLKQLEALSQAVFLLQKSEGNIALALRTPVLVKAMVKAMLVHSAEPRHDDDPDIGAILELQLRAMELIWALSSNPVYNSNSTRASSRVVQHGTILGLVEAMRVNMRYPVLQRLGITCLHNFALDPSDVNQTILADHGVVDRVILGLQVWTTNADFRANLRSHEAVKIGVETLSRLCVRPDNQTAIARRGGLEIIIEAMEAFPITCFHAILALTEGAPTVKGFMGESIVRQIIHTLDRTENAVQLDSKKKVDGGGARDIQLAGISALWRLCANNDPNKRHCNSHDKAHRVIFSAMNHLTAGEEGIPVLVACTGLLRCLCSDLSIFYYRQSSEQKKASPDDLAAQAIVAADVEAGESKEGKEEAKLREEKEEKAKKKLEKEKAKKKKAEEKKRKEEEKKRRAAGLPMEETKSETKLYENMTDEEKAVEDARIAAEAAIYSTFMQTALNEIVVQMMEVALTNSKTWLLQEHILATLSHLVAPHDPPADRKYTGPDLGAVKRYSTALISRVVHDDRYIQHFIGLVRTCVDAVVLERVCKLLASLKSEFLAKTKEEQEIKIQVKGKWTIQVDPKTKLPIKKRYWPYEEINALGEAAIKRLPDPPLLPPPTQPEKVPYEIVANRAPGQLLPLKYSCDWARKCEIEDQQRIALYAVREACMKMMTAYTPDHLKDQVGVLTSYLARLDAENKKQKRGCLKTYICCCFMNELAKQAIAIAR